MAEKTFSTDIWNLEQNPWLELKSWNEIFLGSQVSINEWYFNTMSDLSDFVS